MEMPYRYLPLWLGLLIALPAVATQGQSSVPAEESAQQAEKPQETDPERRDVELKPLSATYTATLERGISISGEATRSLSRRDDGRWLYEFNVDSFLADLRESSVLRYENQRVISDRYRYSLEGYLIGNRYNSYRFDWDNQILKDMQYDREIDISDVPSIQDQLGAQLQLWLDLRAGKTHMEYIIPDDDEDDDFKNYEFAVLREETLDTERFGELETVLVERVRDEDSPRTTHIWFVPEWDHLLVRLDQLNTEGENFRIRLRKATLHDRKIRP